MYYNYILLACKSLAVIKQQGSMHTEKGVITVSESFYLLTYTVYCEIIQVVYK